MSRFMVGYGTGGPIGFCQMARIASEPSRFRLLSRRKCTQLKSAYACDLTSHPLGTGHSHRRGRSHLAGVSPSARSQGAKAATPKSRSGRVKGAAPDGRAVLPDEADLTKHGGFRRQPRSRPENGSRQRLNPHASKDEIDGLCCQLAT